MSGRAVIIGGGLAGAAAAARLGPAATLFEREAGAHDKVCGEFLSGEAQVVLAGLGFDAGRLGGAPIGRICLHSGRRSAEARLPFRSQGLTRRTLDAALLEHAAARGAQIVRGVAVRRLEQGRALTTQGLADAGTLLLATGKHDLRGEPRGTGGTINGLVGFKMLLRSAALAARLAGTVAVVLFKGGYAGLQPVEDGRLNLCLLVEADRLKELGGWAGLLEALVREPGLAGLDSAEWLFEKPLTIAQVPYGYLAQPRPEAGLWRLGDQAAVIPSFCGDGMAMALHSGALAGAMLQAGAGAAEFQAQLRADTSRQVRLATRLQRFATTGPGRLALVAGLGAVPAGLAQLARWTRLPAAAVARASAMQAGLGNRPVSP